jgi:glycine dehydrogenase subunit 1
MPYSPHTEAQRKEMLSAVGVSSIEELFASIPKNLRVKSFNLPKGMPEMKTLDYFKKLADKNNIGLVAFLGAGMYDHFIPTVVDALSSRAEFYTAYTPYQPECSQGTLQALFEYQTAICRLTGMDVSNASLYDGGTALAEAALMAMRLTGRNKIIMDSAVSPFYREVLKTYLANRDAEILELNRNALEKTLDDQTAAVLIQNPDFFGNLDNYSTITEKARSLGVLSIASVYPISLGLVETPGKMGFDIAVGDGQSLGNPISFGGPSLGFIAAKKEHIRQMPGRIVGETIDKNGKRGFVLTLQAREQHIKRQKATSNICSNQSLCALRAVIYLASLGEKGFAECAAQNFQKAEFTKQELLKIKGVSLFNIEPTFNEFTILLPQKAEEIVENLLSAGFAAGLPLKAYYPELENALLVSVTEKRSKEEILSFARELEKALWK